MVSWCVARFSWILIWCFAFQCDNGHLACSSCCPELSNKCPTCASPVGDNRCRAMESVLESILVRCRNANFGCTKYVSYGKETTHEKECNFSQCSCPVLDCNYTGSYKDLFEHHDLTHDISSTTSNSFKCGVPYITFMFMSVKIKIRRVYEKKLLFAVQSFKEPCGLYVTVSCIAPSSPEVGEFSYCLSYAVGGHTNLWITGGEEGSWSEFWNPSREFYVDPTEFIAWVTCWRWRFLSKSWSKSKKAWVIFKD